MASRANNENYIRVKVVNLLRQIFGRFGVPKQIVSDNGPQFTSEQFQAFVRNIGIQHKTPVPWSTGRAA